MKDAMIKEVQQFFNEVFRFDAAVTFLDRQRKFLLKPEILNKADKHEYNALWDLLWEIEETTRLAGQDGLPMRFSGSVLLMFDTHHKLRKKLDEKIT